MPLLQAVSSEKGLFQFSVLFYIVIVQYLLIQSFLIMPHNINVNLQKSEMYNLKNHFMM